MIDPTLKAAAGASLETVVNKALEYDPATRSRLRALAGKSLGVDIRELGLSLCFHFDTEGVRISHLEDDDFEPSTRLCGSLPGLVMLATSEKVNLADSNVEAWGNTALLADIKSIAKELELDWEEAINDWLGDIAGHSLAQRLRGQLGWLRRRGETGRRLLSEFLTEEFRAVPSGPEIKHFNEQVDQLRLAADRLGARFERLKQKITQR
ncbi:hypothetical protein HBA55_07170 [Pseudomaricurvus alkylphenolicus]|uniref:ubiquinone biosynthesis accessory factor UbiJ n=1 Tax=Pseudomaricurvus alkylphenolicus TaxID=1306991 RepID=UPI0014247813|nr:hypothetical protein [Pseudomaricurvus alkylphenolicus]NIB39359.1 hypothetical protein [Pseudomaricurvus alkylphenolicus]